MNRKEALKAVGVAAIASAIPASVGADERIPDHRVLPPNWPEEPGVYVALAVDGRAMLDQEDPFASEALARSYVGKMMVALLDHEGFREAVRNATTDSPTSSVNLVFAVGVASCEF